MTPPQTPQDAPPRRRRRWPWIAVGAVAVIIVIAAFAGNTGTPKPTAAAAVTSTTTAATTTAAQATEADTATASGPQLPTDLAGKTVAQARAELAALGYRNLNITAESSADDDLCSGNDGCVVVSAQDTDGTTSGEVDLAVVATVTAAPAQDTVVYTITGHRAGTITFTNETGDISQVTDTTKLPWTHKWTADTGSEGFLSISAQNAGSGKISCSISINGQVVKQNTSTGTYAIVDCSTG